MAVVIAAVVTAMELENRGVRNEQRTAVKSGSQRGFPRTLFRGLHDRFYKRLPRSNKLFERLVSDRVGTISLWGEDPERFHRECRAWRAGETREGRYGNANASTLRSEAFRRTCDALNHDYADSECVGKRSTFPPAAPFALRAHSITLRLFPLHISGAAVLVPESLILNPPARIHLEPDLPLAR